MAAPTTFRFGAGIFYLESATPGTFTKICGFTSGSMTMDADVADTVIPDCDNPDAAAWTERDVVALSWGMEFEGVMAKEALELLENTWAAGEAANVRMRLVGGGTGAGTPDRQYAGPGILTISKSGERGQKWTATVTVQSAGAMTITNVAAL
jgi:hypothetical protein